MTNVKFGLHYFMWLHERYWDAKSDACAPMGGVYDSSDDSLLNRHSQQIAGLGIDYVILHVPALRSDGTFRHPKVVENAERMIERLGHNGLGYTFLIDVAATDEDRSKLRPESVKNTLDYFRDRGLLQGVIAGPNGKPLILTFSPPGGAYQRRLNAILNAEGFEYAHQVYYPQTSWAESGRELASAGYIRFWQPGFQVDVVNGFASIIPGYNDLLYGRTPKVPIVPRCDGKLLHNQFTSAVERGASHVLIYGWNEYIEATQIEPTSEDGGAAYELTKALISAHKVDCPIGEQEAIEIWHRTQAARNQMVSGGTNVMKTQCFITALYEGVLGRDADAAGRANWIWHLKNGMDPAAVVRGFVSANVAKNADGIAPAPSLELEELSFHDMTLTVKKGDPVQEEIRRYGEHEPWVTNALLSKLRPDSVMVDIGANVGSLSLVAARHAPNGTVFAIEAFPDNTKLLQENVRRNSADNVRIVPIGASDQLGFMTMFCGSDTSNGAVRGGSADVLRDPRFVNVPSITMDQLFSDCERLDLIKIDIEGHEPKALRGAEKIIRKHRPTIICEFSPAYIQAAKCGDAVDFLQFIFNLGYLAKVLHRTKDPENVGNSAEAVIAHYHQAMESRITHLDLMFEAA
jgi:FkbM family methyltransferase